MQRSWACLAVAVCFVVLLAISGSLRLRQHAADDVDRDNRVRIVHILNHHYIPPETFAADLRDLTDTPLSDEEIDRRYIHFLLDLIDFQESQRELLAQLIEQERLTELYVEGWTVEDLALMSSIARTLWRGRDSADLWDDPLVFDKLAFGPAGYLLAKGRLRVLSTESTELLDAANPVDEAGAFAGIDDDAQEAREDFMLAQLLDGAGATRFILLGGAHDLRDNIRRCARTPIEYVRVQAKGYEEFLQRYGRVSAVAEPLPGVP